MKNYEKHIDSFIKEKVGRNPQTPPAHVWEDLDKQLDGLETRKLPYRWLRYFAMVSVVAVLAVFVIMKMFGSSDPSAINSTATGEKTVAKTNGGSQATDKTTATPAGTQTTETPAPVPGSAVAQNTDTRENTTGNNNDQPGAQQGNEQQQTGSTTSQGNTAAGIVDKHVSSAPGKVDHASGTDKKENEAASQNSGTYAAKGNKKNTAAKATLKQNAAIAMERKSDMSKKENGPADKSEHDYYGRSETGLANASRTTGDENDNTDSKQQPVNAPLSANKQAQPSSGSTTTNNGSASGNENNKPADKAQPAKEPVAANKQTDVLPKVAKKESVPVVAVKKHKGMSQPAQRFEEGIKGGYELGFNKGAARKYVAAPYVQYNVSAKVSLLVQPAIKYAQISTRSIGKPQSYYRVNDDGTVTQDDNSVLTTTTQGSYYTTNYTYQETHDSIVKSYTYGGTYMEFELPVLLKYYITKKMSVFGGANLIYSKISGITEHTYTQQGITKSVDFSNVTPSLPTTTPAGLDVSYPGLPYANYTGPVYHATPAQFHIGYMIGFSYEYSRRWLVDALMEQSPLNQKVISGYNINTPLSPCYFRLSIGYRIDNNMHLFGKERDDTGRGD